MRVVTLLDRVALTGRGILDLGRQTGSHRPSPLLGKIHQPPHGQRNLTFLGNFDRDLVGCATYPTGFHLESRLGILQRLVQRIERIDGIRSFPTALDRLLHDPLSNRLFAAPHDSADQTRHHRAAVPAVQGLNLMNDSVPT